MQQDLLSPASTKGGGDTARALCAYQESPDVLEFVMVCNVIIVNRNLQSKNSRDYPQKPQRNCTFINSASIRTETAHLHLSTVHSRKKKIHTAMQQDLLTFVTHLHKGNKRGRDVPRVLYAPIKNLEMSSSLGGGGGGIQLDQIRQRAEQPATDL